MPECTRAVAATSVVSIELGIEREYRSFPVATMNDLRRYPRLSSPKGTIMAWQCASIRQVSRVANFSLCGLYIRTTEPPRTGTIIQLLLNAPAGEVRARAIVQRIEPKRGMGVKLVAMQQEDRARFAGWLRGLSS